MTGRIYFKNQYGASVINDPTYDGFEIAVIAWADLGKEDYEWSLIYDTPVTDDVIRGAPADLVNDILQEIADLPAISPEQALEKIKGERDEILSLVDEDFIDLIVNDE